MRTQLSSSAFLSLVDLPSAIRLLHLLLKRVAGGDFLKSFTQTLCFFRKTKTMKEREAKEISQSHSLWNFPEKLSVRWMSCGAGEHD